MPTLFKCFVQLFILFYWLWKRKRADFGRGFLLGLQSVLLFTGRFLVEFIKENQVAFEDDMVLNMGQRLSIPLILIGIYFMWQSKNKKAETPSQNETEVIT